LEKILKNVFNDLFWESLDFVTNALDNDIARRYTDSKCVYYCKPLLESGTLGTMANVQVVLPFKTKSYGSTKDQEQKQIPQCTIHEFPNLIQHTITWARGLFDSSFVSRPGDTISYLKDSENFLKQNEFNFFALESIYFILKNRPKNFEDCVSWARNKFEEAFVFSIQNILQNYPSDHKTPTGGVFWSGNKKMS